ncbi:MAG: YgjV family protein [Clostridia bacterium]|nr:YgjV family protein [Clostridia bacterium]
MTSYEIIAQTIGIVAMTFNILSFQQKTSKKVIGMQLFGGIFFSINFFMLGAIIGGIMNVIAAFRAIVYINKKKFRSDNIIWLVIFISLYIISYILTFTVFGKEFNLLTGAVELLPVIGMTASTISFRFESAKIIRKLGMICSPSWLIYNIVNFAVGAIICEAISILSIIIGMIRYDIKKKEKPAGI